MCRDSQDPKVLLQHWKQKSHHLHTKLQTHLKKISLFAHKIAEVPQQRNQPAKLAIIFIYSLLITAMQPRFLIDWLCLQICKTTWWRTVNSLVDFVISV
jgi:hypothetical protein